jgi:hypothetical protein
MFKFGFSALDYVCFISRFASTINYSTSNQQQHGGILVLDDVHPILSVTTHWGLVAGLDIANSSLLTAAQAVVYFSWWPMPSIGLGWVV